MATLTLAPLDLLYDHEGLAVTRRPLTDKLAEQVSLADYGAVGDGATNNGSLIADAFADASANGCQLIIPAGVFLFDVPVDVTLNAGALIDGARKFSVLGQGMSSSQLVFVGGNDEDAVKVTGNHPGLDGFSIKSVAISRPNEPLGALTGAGLWLEEVVGPIIEDVLLFNHGVGFRAAGTLALSARGLVCFTNRQAASLGYAGISGPNAMTFTACLFNGNDNGVLVDQGTAINFVGCTFEATGTTGTTAAPADSWALKLANCGREGAGVLPGLPGCYFEGNAGIDIVIDHDDFSATYGFAGATFQRYTVADRPIIQFNDATADSNADAILDLTGMAVRRYGSSGGAATPSATTPVLKLDTSSAFAKLTVIDRDVNYTISGNASYDWRNTPERTDYGARDSVRRDGQPCTVSYSNSWVSETAPNALSASKDLDGWVTLTGAVKDGVTSNDTVMFELPAGFRPSQEALFASAAQTGPCVVRVAANGQVLLRSAVGAGWVSVAGVHFQAS
jgi:hypothetical protein